MISDGHDMHCSCEFPFAHLLESIFPEGHQDRHHSIEFIIRRDLQQCHSGGQEEESHGIQLGESAATLRERESQDIKEDIDDLILAASAAWGFRLWIFIFTCSIAIGLSALCSCC